MFADESESGGYIPEKKIHDQLVALNRAYLPLGVVFYVDRVEHYKNAGWFNNMGPEYQAQTDMKKTLRGGQRAIDLDIYSVGQVLLLLSSKPVI